MFNVHVNSSVKTENVSNKSDNALKLAFMVTNAKMESVFQIIHWINVLLSNVWKVTPVKMVIASKILFANKINMKLHQVVGHHVLQINSANVLIFTHFCIILLSALIQLMVDTSVILSAVKHVKILKF